MSFHDNAPKTTIILDMIIHQKLSIDEVAKRIEWPSLSDCLFEMLGRQDITHEQLASDAMVDRSTIHRILTKKTHPSRDVLLRIAIALKMSFDEIQIFLKSGNCAVLNASTARDLYIIEGIVNHKTLPDINITLYDHNLVDLCGNRPGKPEPLKK